jgi:hypothetical protein
MHTSEKLEHCPPSGCILWVRQTLRREKRMLFVFIFKREDGRTGGLRAHADRMQVLVLGCDSFAIRHLYIRIRPWRHRKNSCSKHGRHGRLCGECTWRVCIGGKYCMLSCGGCVPNRRQGGGQRVSYSGSNRSHWSPMSKTS